VDVSSGTSTAAARPPPLGGALQKWYQGNNPATSDLQSLCAHVIDYLFHDVRLCELRVFCTNTKFM